MTLQKIAHAILSEEGRLLSTRELTITALEKGLWHSDAKDPVSSGAASLDKNVRYGVYNTPELKFFYVEGRRKLGLPKWDEEPATATAPSQPRTKELTIRVPTEVLEHIEFAAQAKVMDTFEETVVLILTEGLSVMAPEIKKRLMEKLNKFGNVGK